MAAKNTHEPVTSQPMMADTSNRPMTVTNQCRVEGYIAYSTHRCSAVALRTAAAARYPERIAPSM